MSFICLGLHAVQGAVYLEESTLEDCSEIFIDGSHKHHAEYHLHTEEKGKTLTQKEFVKWFDDRGCYKQKACVQKGDMLLWDARIAHGIGRPEVSDVAVGKSRWRIVVYVSMCPAVWLTKAERNTRATASINRQGISMWPVEILPDFRGKVPSEVDLHSVPLIGMSPIAKQLIGSSEYDFDDGTSNGPLWRPFIKQI